MLTDEEAQRLTGATLVSGDGEELGAVETVFTHAADDRAAWAVATVGGRRVVVPLDGARTEEGRLLVRHPAERIASAPEADAERLDAAGAEALYAHYGIDDSDLRDDSGFATEQGVRQPGAARDPRAGGGAADGAQGHP
jgi:hypothetical protein